MRRAILPVFLFFGLHVDHAHSPLCTCSVCVVSRKAEANETPGASKMLQRNVDFFSSGNDTIAFAYHQPVNGQDGKHTGTPP